MDHDPNQDRERAGTGPEAAGPGLGTVVRSWTAESQDVEAVARVAGRIAHDINNLLSVILTYTEFLRGAITDATSRDDLEQIVLAARRGAELNSKLLAFSSRRGAATATADVNLAVGTVAAQIASEQDGNVIVESRLSADLPRICCDQAELLQTVTNLVDNAREAMTAGGRLTLTTGRRPADGDPPCEPSELVTISVRDTGGGIDDEILAHLFEPFVSSKPKGIGTGLGLAVVYGTVVRAGGRVEVVSQAGRGTTVTLLFPVADGTC